MDKQLVNKNELFVDNSYRMLTGIMFCYYKSDSLTMQFEIKT